jgi:hypothetical protein
MTAAKLEWAAFLIMAGIAFYEMQAMADERKVGQAERDQGGSTDASCQDIRAHK